MNSRINSSFEYVLPVIRGIQAGREYYVSMCPVRLLPKLFPGDDEVMPPEIRARRTLNRSRIPEISRYILDNPKNYVFSAITASIDANITFEPMGTEAEGRKIGRLRVPMDAKFTINDGNHRRAAFELALKENPDLGYETIALILFLDIGLQHSQQLFTDLNRYLVHPDSSLNLLYDRRDRKANLVKAVVEKVRVFKGLTDMERSSLSVRSRKLFTLSSLYNATLALLVNHQDADLPQQVELAARFWNAVSSYIPDWELVLQRKVSASEMRRDYLHSQAIALTSLGTVGASLISHYPENWESHLAGLQQIDWSLSNPDWQVQLLSSGGISKSKISVNLISKYIQKHLKVSLISNEEQNVCV
jgi:DNA sulfur modification protein DndB